MIFIGCKQSGNPVAPLPTPTSSVSNVKDSVLYTFAVSKDTLGILDTLTMALTALNQATTPDTLYISDYFYTWSLTDENEKTIMSGPTILSNVIIRVLLKSHQSEVLYRIRYTMADIFGAPIEAGSYLLRWNLGGLSFQLVLLCGKTENEITDPYGIISPIYPLKVGNKWTFRKTYSSAGGTVLGSDTVTQTIVGETMIEGEKWFLLRSTDNVDQLMTARQDGIYLYYPDIKTAVLRYKYPVNMGEQYTSGYEEWTGAVDTLVAFSMAVASTNEAISVPSGNYQCYEYYAPEVVATFGIETNGIGSEDMFLSNIGPVKEISGNVFSELLSTNF